MSEDHLSSTECTIVIPGEPIIQLTENGVEGFEILCRICAKSSDHLISIYSEEGISNGLAEKMNLYLPFKVNKTDVLPLQCCYQCASAVVTWHELVIASVEADRRLRNIQDEVEKQLAEEQNAEAGPSQSDIVKTLDSEDERYAVPVNSFTDIVVKQEDRVAVIETVITAPSVAQLNARNKLTFTSFMRNIKNSNHKQETTAQVKRTLVQKHKNQLQESVKKHQKTSARVETSIDNEAIRIERKIDKPVGKSAMTNRVDNVENVRTREADEQQEAANIKPNNLESVNGEPVIDKRFRIKLVRQYDNQDDDKLKDSRTRNKRGRKIVTVKNDTIASNTKICCEGSDMPENAHDSQAKESNLLATSRQIPEQQQEEGHTADQLLADESNDTFSTELSLQPVRKTYQCAICGRHFFQKISLERHTRIHRDERPFTCHVCGKGFRDKSGLTRHISHVHVRTKDFACDVCTLRFASAATRDDHRRRHTKERPYICPTCGKSFGCKATLYIHAKIHTDVFPFECSVCQKRFRRRQEMQAHTHMHSGARPYACPECGKTFRRPNSLALHRLLHSDEKPFKCAICAASYRQQRYLKSHMRVKHSAGAAATTPADTSAVSLNPFRQEQHDTHHHDQQQQQQQAMQPHRQLHSPKVEQSSTGATDDATAVGPIILRKRGRPAKNRQPSKDTDMVKIETNNADLSTDGEWIKTELILEPDEVDPFIADCQLTEEPGLKLNPLASGSDNGSDFDELDPEYDPDNDTEYVPKPKPQHGCPTCTKSFRRLTDVRKHMKHCEPAMKEELLDDEDLGSGEDYTPDNEKKSAERKFKREYRCDYCPAFMLRKGDLKKHIQTAHPDKFENFNEKRQKRRSKIDQEAVNRAKVVVDSRTYYHCNECGKNLHSPYTYIWHNRIHTGERPFVCDLCGKQFRVSQGLVRHLRETHAGIKNFPCDLCGRMFATRRNVEEHRRIHTNERPYICDLCGKAFKQKASLFVHNRSHTDSFPYKCSYCNQGFRTRPPLLVHVTRHTGEKPYACDICGRCFRIKYELKRHRLIHSDDKPFSCTECGLSFRQKRYLRNHNKINHKRPTPLAPLATAKQEPRKTKEERTDEYVTYMDLVYTSERNVDDFQETSNDHFYCQLCLCKFPTKTTYREHNKSMHASITSSKPKPSCKSCNRVFKKDSELARHTKHCDVKQFGDPLDTTSSSANDKCIKVEHNESDDEKTDIVSKLDCEECNDTFDNEDELKEHQNVHENTGNVENLKGKRSRRKKCEIIAEHFCDVCSKGFTRRHDMQKHRAKQHGNVPEAIETESPAVLQNKKNVELLRKCKVISADGKQYYKCEVCAKLIHHSYDFLRHQTIHTGVRPFFCHICGKNYRMSSTLNRHIKELHYRIKKFACEQCGRKFAAKAALDDHTNIHTNERPFICDVCGKSFKQKSSLYIHKLFHTNNFRFSCSVCGKKYRRARDLKVHSWLHTGHRPYSCAICGSMFRLSQDLKRHAKVHNKDSSDCVCTDCGASFSQLRYLKNHRKIHEENSESRIQYAEKNVSA